MRAIAWSLLFTLMFLAACDDPQARKAEEARQQLVGTWLRESEVDGTRTRRVLVLGEDGKFSEFLAAELPGGRMTRNERSGEWAFDGTNLKRRYTREDGRQITNNFAFVTFEITALAPREFDGKNNIQGERIHYVRVPPGTMP